jgi:hypothetical protein
MNRDLHGILPREHGSWAYLQIPLLSALIAAPHTGPAAVWGIAATLLFLSFQGFAAARRRHESFTAAGTIVGAAGILLIAVPAQTHPIALLTLIPSLPPVLFALLHTRGRIGRDDSIEASSLVATAAVGAGAFLVGQGGLRDAVLLAFLACCYCFLSLIWVRVRFARELPGRRPILPSGLNIPVSLVILIAAAAGGLIAGRFIAGFLPGIYCVRLLLPMPRRTDGKVSVTGLGIQEGIAAAFFAIGLGLYVTS